jgi:hypothetical protein
LPITPKFKSASATTDSAKNRQSYLKSCYSGFKFASPHPKFISDFLYEEELLNLRIQAPVCSDTGGNDFLTPASAWLKDCRMIIIIDRSLYPRVLSSHLSSVGNGDQITFESRHCFLLGREMNRTLFNSRARKRSRLLISPVTSYHWL